MYNIYTYTYGWMEKFLQANERLWVVRMPSRARLCRTSPGITAQRWTDRHLSPVGALITLPTVFLSQHRASCYDVSATLDSRTAEGAHPRIAFEGAGLRPGNSSLSIIHEHL